MTTTLASPAVSSRAPRTRPRSPSRGGIFARPGDHRTPRDRPGHCPRPRDPAPLGPRRAPPRHRARGRPSTCSAGSASPSATTGCSPTAASSRAGRSRSRWRAPARWRWRARSSAGSRTTAGTTCSATAPATRTRRTQLRRRVSPDRCAASCTRTSAGSSGANATSAERYAPDLVSDSDVAIISRLFPLFAVFSLARARSSSDGRGRERSAARSPRCSGPARRA